MRPCRRALSAALAATSLTAAGAAAAVALAAAPAAAAAAAAAAANRHADTKAGVASAVYLNRDPAKLLAINASWAYDWSAQAPQQSTNLQWVPMLWGSGSVTPQVIETLKRDRQSGRARYLLGFNEPDSSTQANMTPAQAATLWPQLESTGLLLGSPAPTTPTNGWLARFMGLARQRHLRVNFIALHYYLDYTNPATVAALRAQLIQVHDAYHLPIWITELGALDIRQWGEPMLHAPSAQRAQLYMRRVFSMLDGLPFVQRYAWFTDGCSNDPGCRYSGLFSATGALTPEGREFRQDA